MNVSTSQSTLAGLAYLFHRLGTDSSVNIHSILSTANTLLEGACTLYNRLDDQDKSLVVWSGFNLPEDLCRRDDPRGHICYEATIKGKSGPVAIGDLSGTPYETSDVNVKRFGLRAYLGHPVFLGGRAVGAVAVVYLQPRDFSQDHISIITGLAAAVSLEEERREKELGIRQREEKYRFITENICDIVLISDQDGNYSFISPSHAAVLGRGDEVLGRSIFEHIHEQDRERVLDVFRQGLSTGEAGKVEYRYLHPERGYIWLESTGQRTTGTRGRFQGLITSRDITERKLAEAAIRKSQERFRGMAELLPCAIVELDSDLKVTYVNQTGYDLFGYTEEDLKLGISGLSLLHPEEMNKARNRIEKHCKGIPLPASEYRMLKKDGSEIPVLWNSTPIKSGETITGFRGSIMDLTDLKFLQSEVFKAQKLESVGTLAGGIAHDFNNLLQGIAGSISMIKADLPGDPELSQLLTCAEQSLDRAKDLAKQLLTFARGGEPVKALMTLDRIVRETAEFNLTGSKVGLTLKSDPRLWPVHADKGQMAQVVANLVLNARQAMPDGGRLTITLANRAFRQEPGEPPVQGPHVSILFEDQGVGMTRDQMERIFDPYFTTKKTGSGLGMTIVHSIVTRHGGRILVRSEQGRGSRFEVLLPAADSETGPAEAPPDRTGSSLPRLGARILVMDDDPIVRDLAEKMLKKMDCSVITASEGSEAVRLYRDALAAGTPFDAAIMDLTIPGGMGGMETLKAIRALDPRARAIVASGYSNDPVVAHFREHGFQGYMTKPYRLDELRQAVETALNSGS